MIQFKQMLINIKQYWSPHGCLICGGVTTLSYDLCKGCQLNLPYLQLGCIRCALPLPALKPSQKLTCGRCLANPPAFDKLFSLFAYEIPIPRLIMNLKFHGALAHAKLLGDLLVAKIKTDWYLKQKLPDLIIPVPLHTLRLQERGFNQALEIARPVAKRLQIPINYQAIKRQKATKAQATLSGKERISNLAGAFIGLKHFSGEHIAVIDDVVTTGQTLDVFCQVLRAMGAGRIDVWCCARALANN
jgi:ComF family protein